MCSLFPFQRKKVLDASGHLPAELIQLEQQIKEAKWKQEEYQQWINIHKEDLQRTSQEQNEGKNETSHVQEGCTLYIHRVTLFVSTCISLASYLRINSRLLWGGYFRLEF